MQPIAQFLDLRRATQEYPIGRRKLWLLIKAGRLPAFRLDAKTIVRRADVEKLLLSTRYEPPKLDDGTAAPGTAGLER